MYGHTYPQLYFEMQVQVFVFILLFVEVWRYIPPGNSCCHPSNGCEWNYIFGARK